MKITGTILVGNDECKSMLGHILAHIENLMTYIGPDRMLRDFLRAAEVTAIAKVERLEIGNATVWPKYEEEEFYCSKFPRKSNSIDSNIWVWRSAFNHLIRDSAITYAFLAASSDGDTAGYFAETSVSLFDIHAEYRTELAASEIRGEMEVPF